MNEQPANCNFMDEGECEPFGGMHHCICSPLYRMGWTQRAWVAEPPRRRSGDSPYVLWDIPDVREALSADYERRGWTIHGPYPLPPNGGGREGRLMALREHGRAIASDK